jgi:acetyl esterase/lipase
MPIGYVIPVVLIAFCTTVAVIGPRPPHSTPSYWGYWATFQINEQPFVAFYLLAIPTVLAFAQGDLASPGGLAAFAVAVLTVAGLAVLVRRALRAGPAVRRALADGAGIDLPLRRRPWAHILFAPLSVRRRDVTRVSNIAYGDAGRHNLLDVYHRRDRPTGAPILVYMHGGGFHIGSKNREGRALLNHLAAQGWVCVSANYRLAPAAQFPDYLIDAKKAIAWVRDHAGEYGGDPRTIVASGSSAGGHLASMLAFTPNDPEFQPGFETADTSISAAIGFYGYYGRVAGPGSSPLDRLGDAPPFFFVHGDKDSSTLVEDTREFVARLRRASSHPVLYAELPGAQHTFDLLFSLRYSYVIEAVTAFCGWLRATQPKR